MDTDEFGQYGLGWLCVCDKVIICHSSQCSLYVYESDKYHKQIIVVTQGKLVSIKKSRTFRPHLDWGKISCFLCFSCENELNPVKFLRSKGGMHISIIGISGCKCKFVELCAIW